MKFIEIVSKKRQRKYSYHSRTWYYEKYISLFGGQILIPWDPADQLEWIAFGSLVLLILTILALAMLFD